MNNDVFTGIIFLPYNRVHTKKQDPSLRPNALFVDVSSYGPAGWNALSPFYNHGGIPVPGMPGVVSNTVEAIWQGLKRMEDRPENLALFEQAKAGKVKGKPLGHVYEGRVLDGIVEARELIYVPAYRAMVEQCPKAQAKYRELVALARTHFIYVYDRMSNGDIKVDKPWAHAALLAEMVKAELKRALVTP